MSSAQASAWGIDAGYRDRDGRWREPGDQAVEAVLEAMGAEADHPPGTAPIVVRPGGRLPVIGPAELVLEDGSAVRVDGKLPPDLPLGYHRLEDRLVILSPGRCHLPVELHTWGWAVQLYSLWSEASAGMGDLGDLRALARWSSRELGAGVVMVNPLHADAPALPQQPSPYFPASRRFRNPLYLRVDGLAGAAGPGSALVDRDAVFGAKMAALSDAFAKEPGSAEFALWCDGQGPALEAWATFCVLTEEHGRDWRLWPSPLRDAGGAEVAAFGRTHRSRLRFHMWLQWLLDRQLESVADELSVVHDLAIGCDPGGADTWIWPGAFATGVTVGAPPDEFNTQGQDWGLPPFDPWRLRAMDYEPFIQVLRASLRHAGGLRIDHVMGLYRLYWVPEGGSPRDGAYVRYPPELLDILALESHRAGAFVVGEDLGTVEDRVRHDLARRGVMSYRLLWFEDRPPSEYPRQALAAVTTHDLPTVAGQWTGSDLDAQRRLGLEPNEEALVALNRRLGDMLGLSPGAPVEEVVLSAYEALAGAPSMVLVAALEDALAVLERPNMPGTIDQWPNWAQRLPLSLEDLMADPRPRRLAAALRR